LVIIAILVLSTVLTPLVHAALNPWFKFEKIFNRLVMLFALIAAACFVRVRHESWQGYGFDFKQPVRRLAAYGFLMGFLMVFLITVYETAFGPRHLREPIFFSDILQRFLKGFASGAAVGIAEEFFFRGFLFIQLEKKWKTQAALILTSAFYSLSHFFDNGQIFIPSKPDLGDAVRLLLGYLEPFALRPLEILPEFIGLFLFGILLSLAFLRTGRSLFVPIGIHAGSVFCIKFQNAFLRKGDETFSLWLGSAPHYDGLFEWLFLLGICALLYFWPSPSKRQIENSI
jgi:membrane protease YdiL (CAAX protease family)